ncbi:MAG: hypothetical protein ILP16_01695 [Spirochaetales bacterium]|nr:hypothetical protein [Spirochaetales bacterium]
MSKKLISVICVALLVLSFASARVINFAIGPSVSYSAGKVPVKESAGSTADYSGFMFGLDGTVSLTFGERAEIYFQDQFNISDKTAFEDLVTPGYKPAVSIDYISRVGYEHAILKGPVKLSAGGGVVVEVLTSFYQNETDEEKMVFPIVLNVGFGLTAKAEFSLGNHFALYVKGFADYYPSTAITVGVVPDTESEPPVYTGAMNNLSFSGSAGVILFF